MIQGRGLTQKMKFEDGRNGAQILLQNNTATINLTALQGVNNSAQ